MNPTKFSKSEQPQGRTIPIAAELHGGVSGVECAVTVARANDRPQGNLIENLRRIQAARLQTPASSGIIGTPLAFIPQATLVRLKERNALLQMELQLTKKTVATLEGEKAQLQRDYQDMLDMFVEPWRA